MTTTPFAMPRGAADLSARPLTVADTEAVVALMRAEECEVLAESMTEAVDIRAAWRQPSIDLRRDSLAIRDGEHVVAFAFLAGPGTGEITVAPDHRGRGFGTALVTWLRAAAAARSQPTLGQTVPVGGPAEAFLIGMGARATYDTWVLELAPGHTLPAPPLPDNHVLDLARDDELPTVHRLIDDAFCAWPGREPVSYADWSADFLEGDDAAPWQRRVVRDGAGDVIGAAMVAASDNGMVWVNQLAVRPDRRSEGLGRALLMDAFADGRRRGLPRAGLATDSRTGALPLYEAVGMVVTGTFRHLVLDV